MKDEKTVSRQQAMEQVAAMLRFTAFEASRLAANGVHLDPNNFSRSPHGLLMFRSKPVRLMYAAPARPDRSLTTLVYSRETTKPGDTLRNFDVFAYGIKIGTISEDRINGWLVEPITGGKRRAQEYSMGIADSKRDAVRQLLYVMARA